MVVVEVEVVAAAVVVWPPTGWGRAQSVSVVVGRWLLLLPLHCRPPRPRPPGAEVVAHARGLDVAAHASTHAAQPTTPYRRCHAVLRRLSNHPPTLQHMPKKLRKRIGI
jgi:hypothetical protein